MGVLRRDTRKPSEIASGGFSLYSRHMSTNTQTPARLDFRTLTLARTYLNDERRMFADFEEECAEYARQGFRPHFCVHGTDQWTDYDNICGPCEDGQGSWDYVSAAGRAIARAKAARERFTDGLVALEGLRKYVGPDFDLFPIAMVIRDRTLGKGH